VIDLSNYSNKIICGNCGSTYIKKNERGKSKWICQRFEELSSCASKIVSEEALTEFLSRRLWIDERTPESVKHFIETKVEKIVVKDAYNFIASIRGQGPMFWNGPNIQF
jgi:hypothetical protein